jgi:phosphopantothenoylcysteine synthetase/decarboxylase
VSERPALYVIGSAAPPVRQLADGCRLAIAAGWQPYVTLTPTAAGWVDLTDLATVTGQPIRVEQRRPDDPEPLPPAVAVLAAPLTFNTINKWAAGINDTLALGLLNELVGSGLTIVAAPCVKAALQAHPAYETSLRELRDAGVRFVDSSGGERGPGGLVRFDWYGVVRHLSRAPGASEDEPSGTAAG